MKAVRVALLTEIIAPYRIEPFNCLAADPDIDLSVYFFAETESRREWQVPSDSIRFRYEVLPGRQIGTMYQGGALFVNPSVVPRLLKSRPDVVVCGGWHHPTIWLAVLAARVTGARLLIWSESTLRDARNPGRIKEWIKRRIVRSADRYVVPGSAQRAYLRALGATDDRIHLAPNAVHNAFFAGAGVPADGAERLRESLGLESPVVLYVGRLLDEKGVPELLQVALELSDVTFLIVGSGPDAERYIRWCAEHGARNVRFAGFQEQEALPSFYHLADVFVFPTHSDPWGLVLNEAMAAALPVICSDAAGAGPDLIREGDNGYLYPAGDVASLRGALQRMLADPERALRMGRRSAEIVEQFSPARMAKGFAMAARAAIGGANEREDT